ncbi:MAG: hypothetical protein IPK33_20130 [Gemmatimonadetes bacterium]|nr:hypothetical protein [Gemmatimonadota bacterium]
MVIGDLPATIAAFRAFRARLEPLGSPSQVDLSDLDVVCEPTAPTAAAQGGS